MRLIALFPLCALFGSLNASCVFYGNTRSPSSENISFYRSHNELQTIPTPNGTNITVNRTVEDSTPDSRSIINLIYGNFSLAECHNTEDDRRAAICKDIIENPQNCSFHVASFTNIQSNFDEMFNFSRVTINEIHIQDIHDYPDEVTSALTNAEPLQQLYEITIENVTLRSNLTEPFRFCADALQVITLYDTRVEYINAAVFEQCTNLRTLILQNNYIQTIDLMGLPNLIRLNLNRNQNLYSVTMEPTSAVYCSIEGTSISRSQTCESPQHGTQWLQRKEIVIEFGKSIDKSNTEKALNLTFGLSISVFVIFSIAGVIFLLEEGKEKGWIPLKSY